MHIPVLVREVIEGLSIEENDHVLDMTLGEGGHALEITQYLGKDGYYIGIDADSAALSRAREKLEGHTTCHTHFYHGNFENFERALQEAEIKTINKVLFDLGLRSSALEESGRGFSFQKDEPLVMTFGDNVTEDSLTAEEIVNTWEEENLSDVIYGFGGERYARRIAKAIVEARQKKPIKTTTELKEIIESAVPSSYKKGRIHPATKTFQALRIAVNRELSVLEQTLKALKPYMNLGARIAVISFHSLEDRIVKNIFRAWDKEGYGRAYTKKPIVPTDDEVNINPRSRSAKLRIFEITHEN